MSSSIVSRVAIAERYMELGWPVFVLGHKKTPIKNCPRCDRLAVTYITHDAETCTCVTCHGFYAATLDIDRFVRMLDIRPDGKTAVRTGGLGRLLVIDAEGGADPNADDDVTGLDVLDDWLGWTGFELTQTLRQRTPSGGLHLVYRLPVGVSIRGVPRVLPQVDIKAEGGYIVVTDGTEPDRHWVNSINDLADVQHELLEWLDTRKGKLAHRSGRGGRGVLLDDEKYRIALRDGVRAGEREPFFARLSFELRKRGLPEWDVEQTLHFHWERCEQPPGDFFHWQYVEYKMVRDRTIRPDAQVPDSLKAWAMNQGQPIDTTPYQKVGRITLARRSQ